MTTVAALLADPTLDLVPVHLANTDDDVRWVATSELVDPTPFLEGGEVLLTTGLETAGWRGEWRTYVDRLAAAGVVALGLATGLTHRGVPASLVRACREAGLTLVEVPRRTTFVSISRAAALLINSAAEVAARDSLQAQRQLTQAALRRREPGLLVERLARAVDGAAVVLDADGSATLGPLGLLADDLDPDLLRAEVTRLRPQGLRAASSLQTATGTLVVQPVGLVGRPSSYLAVLVPGRPGDLARAAVATAVSLLGLAAETDAAQRQSTRRLRARALEILVDGDATTAAVVLSAGHERPATLPDRVAAIRCQGPGEALDDALAAVEDTVPLSGRCGEELWLLVRPGLAARHAEDLGARGLLVGVGDQADLTAAGRSHGNAGHALQAATTATPVVHWDRLVAEGAMGALDAPRAAAFAVSYLAPIVADEVLIATLRSFLRHHGSRLKVAEDLGVHRNTVRNRIEGIEAGLGNSLDDPQVRVSAWIALQVLANSS